MGWTKFQYIIVITFVATGSINILDAKWSNHMEAKDADGKIRKFNHPFLQALCMFIGEFMCLGVVKCVKYYYKRKGDDTAAEQNMLLKGNKRYNRFLLLPPAACDMVAASIMYVGLNLTHTSSYQMFKGAVIIFVVILSLIFLQRKLTLVECVGILALIAGLVLIGMSEHLLTSSNNSTENEAEHSSRAVRDVIIGDCLIFAAQTVAAAQFVLEDKYVGGLDIPALEAVGYEGMFGVIMLGLLLIPFNFIKVPKPFSDNSRGTMEDVVGACVQIKNNLLLIVPLIGLIISVAFFNFTGITVTKEFSATTRMVLDSLRTLIIYLFTLAVTWQKFYWLQIPGFILLVFGTLMYNNAFLPLFNCCKAKRAARRESAAKPQENASSTEE